MKRLWMCLPLLCWMGCASTPPVTPAPTKIKIKRIAVNPLIGPNKADFTPDVTAALQGGSIVIVGASQPADARLVSEVLHYKNQRKLLVYLGNTQAVTKDQAQMLSNPIFPTTTNQIIPQAPTSGGPIPRIVTETAVVQMRMRLFDESGRLLWANEYSYEGLDIVQTRRVVIQVLVQGLKLAIPDLQAQPVGNPS